MMAPSTAPHARSTRTWSSLPRNVRLLGIVSFLNDIASEMIFPLLPQFFLSVLGGSKFQLGLMEGIAESASSLLKLVFGGLSDRLRSRKGLVVVGYTVASCARPLIGLSTQTWHVVACRFLDRSGKGIRTAPRDALIADSVSPDRRGVAFGFHRAMDHLGAAIGPLLATTFLLLFPGELRWLFLATAIPGVMVVGIVALGLREPKVERSLNGPKLTWGMLDRDFRIYLAALVVFTLGNASDAFLLVRAQELGVPIWALPLLWCAFGLAKSGGNLLAGEAADRLPAKRLIIGGWFFYAATYMAFAFASTAWHAWALFLVYAVFYAMTEPAEKKLVADLSAVENRGTAFGWFNLAIGVTALPSSLLFGWLYQDYGAWAAFGLGSALALFAAGLLLAVAVPDTTRDS